MFDVTFMVNSIHKAESQLIMENSLKTSHKKGWLKISNTYLRFNESDCLDEMWYYGTYHM